MIDRVYTAAEGREIVRTGRLPRAHRSPAAPPSDMVRLKPTETEQCIALAEWLRLMRSIGRLKARFCHIANERQGELARIHAWRMGVESGAPDYLFCLPGGLGGVIEMKAEGGRLSKEQREWRDDLIALGWKWEQREDIEGVQQVLTEWGVYVDR